MVVVGLLSFVLVEPGVVDCTYNLKRPVVFQVKVIKFIVNVTTTVEKGTNQHIVLFYSQEMRKRPAFRP